MKSLNEYLKPYNISLTEKQINQFNTYYELIVETNKKFNLTSIIEPKEVIIKHFFDSITPAFFVDFSNQKIIDIGAGAGFPSIPLKICFPELNITLVDSLNKRVNFLKMVVDELKLQDVICYHSRSEDLAKKNNHRECYDLALSRAVARLNILCELCLPFVKVDGYMIALKGVNVSSELEEANLAIRECGGNVYKNDHLELPENNGKRSILIINKVKKTPNKYPRKSGEPNRNPLI